MKTVTYNLVWEATFEMPDDVTDDERDGLIRTIGDSTFSLNVQYGWALGKLEKPRLVSITKM